MIGSGEAFGYRRGRAVAVCLLASLTPWATAGAERVAVCFPYSIWGSNRQPARGDLSRYQPEIRTGNPTKIRGQGTPVRNGGVLHGAAVDRPRVIRGEIGKSPGWNASEIDSENIH